MERRKHRFQQKDERPDNATAPAHQVLPGKLQHLERPWCAGSGKVQYREQFTILVPEAGPWLFQFQMIDQALAEQAEGRQRRLFTDAMDDDQPSTLPAGTVHTVTSLHFASAVIVGRRAPAAL